MGSKERNKIIEEECYKISLLGAIVVLPIIFLGGIALLLVFAWAF